MAIPRLGRGGCSHCECCYTNHHRPGGGRSPCIHYSVLRRRRPTTNSYSTKELHNNAIVVDIITHLLNPIPLERRNVGDILLLCMIIFVLRGMRYYDRRGSRRRKAEVTMANGHGHSARVRSTIRRYCQFDFYLNFLPAKSRSINI